MDHATLISSAFVYINGDKIIFHSEAGEISKKDLQNYFSWVYSKITGNTRRVSFKYARTSKVINDLIFKYDVTKIGIKDLSLKLEDGILDEAKNKNNLLLQILKKIFPFSDSEIIVKMNKLKGGESYDDFLYFLFNENYDELVGENRNYEVWLRDREHKNSETKLSNLFNKISISEIKASESIYNLNEKELNQLLTNFHEFIETEGKQE